MNQLIIDHQPLVKSIANKYSRGSIEFKDLVQEGNIGLLKALQSYNPEFKTTFGTYAKYFVIGEIVSYVDRHIKYSSIIELTDNDYSENIIGPETIFLAEESKIQCNRLLDGLDDRSKDIVVSRWMEESPLKLRELSNKYKISKERIRQIEKETLLVLKQKASD